MFELREDELDAGSKRILFHRRPELLHGFDGRRKLDFVQAVLIRVSLNIGPVIAERIINLPAQYTSHVYRRRNTSRTTCGQDFGEHVISGSEERPWLADYRAGWTYAGLDTGSPNWSTEKGTTSTGQRTLPGDVEEAVIQKVSRVYSGTDDIVSEKIGDLAVNYRSQGTDAAGTTAEKILGRYRRFI